MALMLGSNRPSVAGGFGSEPFCRRAMPVAIPPRRCRQVLRKTSARPPGRRSASIVLKVPFFTRQMPLAQATQMLVIASGCQVDHPPKLRLPSVCELIGNQAVPADPEKAPIRRKRQPPWNPPPAPPAYSWWCAGPQLDPLTAPQSGSGLKGQTRPIFASSVRLTKGIASPEFVEHNPGQTVIKV